MNRSLNKLFVIAVLGLALLLSHEARADDPPPFFLTWGTPGGGDGQFSYPFGVATDASGNVYVADTGNHRIQKFTSSGAFLTTWGSSGSGSGEFTWPSSVAVDASGNVYVADLGNHRIQKFTSGGAFLTTWGSYGSGPGQFSSPQGVAIDASGNVYVADSDNNHIQKSTSDGTFVTKWGSPGSGDGQLFGPRGVCADGGVYVYVADTGNHRIQKFGLVVVSVLEAGTPPPSLHLSPSIPNPWTGSTTLRFTLARAERATLTVYDVYGRRLKRWSELTLSAGPHQIIWDGRTDDGRQTPNGVLFYRLEVSGQTLTQKMVHLR